MNRFGLGIFALDMYSRSLSGSELAIGITMSCHLSDKRARNLSGRKARFILLVCKYLANSSDKATNTGKDEGQCDEDGVI